MWGKFGQRMDRKDVTEFTDHQDLVNFLDSNHYITRYVSLITEERVEVHSKRQELEIPVNPNLNIFVEAFTTCHARLKLYKALDLLGERVLYFDRFCHFHSTTSG